MKLKLLREIPKEKLAGKRVVFRVDFEVPIKDGQVQEDFRIKETFPTFQYLLSAGARILILAKRGHLKIGRNPELSTKLLIPYLEKSLKQSITFIENLERLSDFRKSSAQLFIFENLRFWPEEEANNENFAKTLAQAGDIYVSDNFGVAHRAHASISAITKFLPSYAGFLLEKEITSLEKISENPARPVVAILGGAKLETKLPLIQRFLEKKSHVLVAGKLANTILMAKGVRMAEECGEKGINQYLDGLDLSEPNLHLPVDGHLGKKNPNSGETTDLGYRSNAELSSEGCFWDAGPETIKNFSEVLQNAKTIFWNGPVGVCEDERFAGGTRTLAEFLKKVPAFKVTGGGDSIAAFNKLGLLDVFDHISTGGGSMLEFLAGKKLPGVEVLRADN